MTATMTGTTQADPTVRDDAHAPVGAVAAFTRQFRLLWTSRRPILLGVALLALLALAGDPWADDPKTRLLTFWPLWLVLVGPIWAFAVFHNEGPGNRLYHWSLPTGRVRHTLARVAAGAAWLWLLFAVLIGAGALMAALDGDLWQLGAIDAAGWVNFFTAPLIGYLGVSILTVASDYPLRWFFGIMFAFPLTLSILAEWIGQEWLVEYILQPLGGESWALIPVLIGGLGSSVFDLERTLSGQAGAPGTFEIGTWWWATPLWIVLLGAVVAWVASRHPDTLPRLRRSG